MMKVGISQLIASGKSLDEFFEVSAQAGYEVVELALRREGELTTETSPEALAAIRQSAADRGLSIDSITLSHCMGSLLNSGESQQTAIAEVKRGLEIASALGAYCTLYALGTRGPDLYYDDAYRNGVESFKQVAPVAEELGVDVAIEFVWSGFLFSPMETRNFLNEVGSDAVGFYFDPGNMAVFQYPHHWARIVGPQIKMMHAKDWKGRALNGGWTPLLEGEVDFPAVMRELVAAGYDRPVISEVSPNLAPFDATAKAIRQIIEMANSG